MPKMNFHMGVTLRCYGNVEIEAESIEAALPLLTADYIGEHIDIKETTTDSGMDLAIIDVSDADTGEELADYGGHGLPSPYDPQAFPKTLVKAASAIIRQRDFYAEFTAYDPTDFHPEGDQCFDDWAADILEQAMQTDGVEKAEG